MAVWGRARYLSVTEAPHNIESSRVSGEETCCFFETWRPEWGSSPRSTTFQAALPTASGPPPLFDCSRYSSQTQQFYIPTLEFLPLIFSVTDISATAARVTSHNHRHIWHQASPGECITYINSYIICMPVCVVVHQVAVVTLLTGFKITFTNSFIYSSCYKHDNGKRHH